MSGIVSCSRCERIKDEAEDCEFLGCNPELTWSETGPYELYGLLREMRTERDEARRANERLAGEINNLLAFMPDSADPMTWEFMDYGLPWMLSRDALVAIDECIDALAAAPPPASE